MDTSKTLLLKNIDGFPDSIKLSDVSEENQKFIEGYVFWGSIYKMYMLEEDKGN